jgi:hypothetical protein
MFTCPKSSTRWNQQTLIPAPILTRHRPVNNQSLSDFDWFGRLCLRKLCQPIARQFFDRAAKAGANFFQIALAATGNFCDGSFALWSRNNGEPLAPYFTQRRFVGCEPDRAGSLSPNEHQPTTKKLFLLRAFSLLLLRHFLR